MDRQHAISLLIVEDTFVHQICRDLSRRLDLRQISHGRDVLISEVIDHVDVVLQTIGDEFTHHLFIEDAARGIVRIIDGDRAMLRLIRIFAAQVFDLRDQAVASSSSVGVNGTAWTFGKHCSYDQLKSGITTSVMSQWKPRIPSAVRDEPLAIRHASGPY